jgi:hypothetical protein
MFRKIAGKSVRANRDGLILLLVLGMLALFSLLAVTYMVAASNSRAGAQAMRIRANASSTTTVGLTDEVVRQAIRGTRDQKSVFYQHSLLDDIYGQHPVRGRFGHLEIRAKGSDYFRNIPPPLNPWCFRLLASFNNPRNFVKLSLFPRNPQLYGFDPTSPPLSTAPALVSPFENTYNSRLITILEGPLAGQSFRIIKYVGYVQTGSAYGNLPDPNFRAGEAPILPNGHDLDYSILIDLSELDKKQISGSLVDLTNARDIPFQGTIDQWLVNPMGLLSLFYRYNFAIDRPEGYRFVINDAAFNNAGIGMGDFDTLNPVTAASGYGNLDSRNVMRIPTNGSVKKIPPALLPNYDYLQNPNYVNPMPRVLGDTNLRNSGTENILRGGSNEGFDVPDWHDFWLAHQSNLQAPSGFPSANIIPSFHRPELVYYFAQAIRNANNSTPSSSDLRDLIRLIDASSGRVMSYSNSNIGLESVNPQFAPHPDFPRLQDSANPADLIEYVARQILGPWDVDNDFDGISDSVWIDPNLPIIKSPDGKSLKPLAAILIQDLDGAINVNVHGDRAQSDLVFVPGAPNTPGTYNSNGYDSLLTLLGFVRRGTPVPQGFGYGPADISLRPLRDLLIPPPYTVPRQSNRLIRPSAFLLTSAESFFNDRYGVRRNPNDVAPGFVGNDATSQIVARERELPFSHGNPPASVGAPTGNRTDVYPSFDQFGNLAYEFRSIQGANALAPTAPSKTIAADDEAYELRSLNLSAGDDPFTLVELEAILRKFDDDAASLPSRLRNKFADMSIVSSEITRLLTTRSVELRHPPLAAAMTTLNQNFLTVRTNNPIAPSDATTLVTAKDENLMGFQGLIKMLHEQRYRRRTITIPAPLPPQRDDPELTASDINVLFGMEIAQGRKLDLNRPFGNGFDDNNNGVIDEPGESEAMDRYQTSPVPGRYRNGIRDASLLRGRLGSRQVLARNLYCLAQLIVPREYRFPGMGASPHNITDFRIRARHLAQWAINVVDFRDNDSVCTRFEYDILPFGYAPPPNPPANAPVFKFPFWAPDKNVIANAPFIGVVWGMEAPELLLTESLAFHDKRLRDTDLEGGANPNLLDAQDNPDTTMDQYRFPQGSLILELYAPRTTSTLPSDTVGRVDYGLYTNDGTSTFLNLQATAPGGMPVWRIGISDIQELGKSLNDAYQTATGGNLTIPTSLLSTTSIEFNANPQGNPSGTTLEEIMGSGMYADFANQDPTPQEFDRMIWFLDENQSNVILSGTVAVPDLKLHGDKLPANQYQPHQVYFNRSGTPALMRGGQYLTLLPRETTYVGSRSRDPRTPAPHTRWPKALQRNSLNPSEPDSLPIHTPSRQSISRDPATGRVITTTLSGEESLNSTPWDAVVRNLSNQSIVISTNAPNPSWENTPTRQEAPFPNGVGLNISMPHPIADPIATYRYWTASNRPDRRLNSQDNAPNGFANLPRDTWFDAGTLTGTLKDIPFDHPNANDPSSSFNPVLNDPRRICYRTGTYPNVRTAVLQRLADPRLPWDAVANPYISVDWISIDLTVFNGEAPMGDDPIKDDPQDPVITSGDRVRSANGSDQNGRRVAFQSRYKDGDEAMSASQKKDIDLISPGTPINNQPESRGVKSLMGLNTRWGLSYLSSSTGQLRETPLQLPFLLNAPLNDVFFPVQLGYASQLPANPTQLHNSSTSFGYANVGYHFDSLQYTSQKTEEFDAFGPPRFGADPGYNGLVEDITSPIWLNRPFVSIYELMQVPYTSADRYGLTWSIRSATGLPNAEPKHLFATLPSFLDSNQLRVDQNSTTTASTLAASDRGIWAETLPSSTPPPNMDLSLLFDFIEVPSPFSDTATYQSGTALEQQLNPTGVESRIRVVQQRFLGQDPGDGTSTGPSLLAPFNSTPSFRVPGKVNLNTVHRLSDGSMPALRAIEYNYFKNGAGLFPGDVANYDNPFFLNRRGFAPRTADLFNSATTPAANALATAPHLNGFYPTQFAGAFRPEISSVFHPEVMTPGSPLPPEQLANRQLRNRFSTEATLMRSFGPFDRNEDGSRQTQPYFSPTTVLNGQPGIGSSAVDVSDANRNAFTRYQRAMRLPNLVTDQSNVFAVWVTVGLFEYDPVSGFGREYVNASGEEQRERSFYIIDRTVPVGFIPGENLNTEKTILLQRKISGDR